MPEDTALYTALDIPNHRLMGQNLWWEVADWFSKSGSKGTPLLIRLTSKCVLPLESFLVVFGSSHIAPSVIEEKDIWKEMSFIYKLELKATLFLDTQSTNRTVPLSIAVLGNHWFEPELRLIREFFFFFWTFSRALDKILVIYCY